VAANTKKEFPVIHAHSSELKSSTFLRSPFWMVMTPLL
jgi:hypothetical protein